MSLHSIIDPSLQPALQPMTAETPQPRVNHHHSDGNLTDVFGRPPGGAGGVVTSVLQASPYVGLTLAQLKGRCREKHLKLRGSKADLRQRLEEHDGLHASPPQVPRLEAALSLDAPEFFPSPFQPPPRRNTTSEQAVLEGGVTGIVIDAEKAVEDAITMEDFFQEGLERGENDESDGAGQEEEEDLADVDEEDEREEIHAIDNNKTHDALQWADKFILDTRRSGGRQTEYSVLKLWKAWTVRAINAGIIPDAIVDAHHKLECMKEAATRELLDRRGVKKNSEARLSAASLKKLMTMLGRVRKRQEDENPEICITRPHSNSRTQDFYKAVMVQSQRLRLASEDFDISKGTILDSELRPEHFEEITAAILEKTNSLPSIIKAHFSWTWQCSTLNRSDEVVSLLMSCIQPYGLRLPDYVFGKNKQLSSSHREQLGVLGMYHETKTAQPGKTEPKYSFVLPHRNPLQCPIGALAIHLHFMFDQAKLVSQIPSWDWGNAATWRAVHVMFGKKVEDTLTGDGLGRIYSAFLKRTEITSKKKTHLARRTMPTLLEDMGVPADQVDATGHWQGNTRREVYGSKIPKLATVALAGFPVGETYYVPWAQVEVPSALQQQIFPFCEDVIASLRASGCTNQGTYNFLELLQILRPFFWRAISAINQHFPDSPIVKRLHILSQNEPAQSFMRQWPELRQQEEAKNNITAALGNAFHETPTQNAFSTLSAQVQGIQSQISIIKRRTDQFSPSKSSLPASSIPPQSHWPVPALPWVAPNSFIPAPTTPPPLLNYSAPFPTTPPRRPVCNQQDYGPLNPSPGPSASFERTPAGAVRAPNVLMPVSLSGSKQRIYHVLRLAEPISPIRAGEAGLHTTYDKILPPRHAYPHSTYPIFTACDCTWQYTLKTVSNPSALWELYAPENLGDYPTITALWEAWDEGAYVVDVGRKPALRLIEGRWGSLKNKETNKGTFPAWRPSKNNTARKIWSKFYYFISRIEGLINTGHSSDDAIKYFEDLRLQENKTVNQLYTSLTAKKGGVEEA